MPESPDLEDPIIQRTPMGVEYVRLSDIDPALRDECLRYARARRAVLLLPDDTMAVFVEEWRDWAASRADEGVGSLQPPETRTSSYWNLRVIEFEAGEDSHSAIHEVHYYADGRLKGYSATPAVVMWTVDDEPGAGRRALERFQRALSEPSIKVSDFE